MDDRGNIYSAEDLLKMLGENREKLEKLGKLIEILPEEENDVLNMNNEDRRKWYAKMLNNRREFPIPK